MVEGKRQRKLKMKLLWLHQQYRRGVILESLRIFDMDEVTAKEDTKEVVITYVGNAKLYP